MFLFQKGIMDADTKRELTNAKSISRNPNLSCNFKTKMYKTKEEIKLMRRYSVRGNPILRKAFNNK